MTGADRPRLVLLVWAYVGKPPVVGRAKVRLPCGIEISDIGVFEKGGRRWAQLPAEPLRDYATGQPLKDPAGKVRYKSSLAVGGAAAARFINRPVLPPLPIAPIVIVGADNDRNGVGERAAHTAAWRWLAEGRRVRIALPSEPGSDWNDVLNMGARNAA